VLSDLALGLIGLGSLDPKTTEGCRHLVVELLRERHVVGFLFVRGWE
jgi:hypothetical protein